MVLGLQKMSSGKICCFLQVIQMFELVVDNYWFWVFQGLNVFATKIFVPFSV